MSLPDWKKVIDTEFNNYKSGKQNKNAYYTNLISYFTGGGTGNYPVAGQKVNPTDLSPAEIVKYELPAFDIRKIAMAQAIQSNMVNSTRLPRDWAGVKGLINTMKQDARFARSPPFDNYTADEKAIWENCQVPVIGTGTKSSPTNDPLYNKLCDIYNNPGSKALRDAGNWEKYYGDFALGGIGPAGGFIGGDWDKSFIQLTQDQLDAFQLPSDDGRRLQICMTIEQYKAALAKNPSTSKQAYVANIQATYDDKKFQFSPPLTAAEKTMFESLKVPVSPKIAAQMERAASSAVAQGASSAAAVKREANAAAAAAKAAANAAAADEAARIAEEQLFDAIKFSVGKCASQPNTWFDENTAKCVSCGTSPKAIPGLGGLYEKQKIVKEATCTGVLPVRKYEMRRKSAPASWAATACGALPTRGGYRKRRSSTRRKKSSKKKRGSRRH